MGSLPLNAAAVASSEEESTANDPKQTQHPRDHFNTSNLYSLEIINALLARQPLEAKQARKPLLAAKVYLESSKINKNFPTDAILELCDTRMELAACHLCEKEVPLAESEALQVLAACKKISKSTRNRPLSNDTPQDLNSAERDTAAWCLRTQIRALELLSDMDDERGISARAARWRETRARLEERLRLLGT